MFRAICAIACLASSTRAQFKYNQSRKDAWDNVRNYSTRGELSNIELANLMGVLDLASNCKEFQPLKISIATLGQTPDLSGRISKFLVQKLIGSYQVKLGTDLHTALLSDQIGLTWIILIENRHSFESYVSWSRTLWSPRDKYIIFILDRDTNHSDLEAWKKVLSLLWNRNRVIKILIGSVVDQFQYFYKYHPFIIEGEEYGSIQKFLIDEENVNIFLNNSNNRKIKLKDNVKLESSDEVLFLKDMRTLFEDFKNLNNYPMHVTAFTSQLMKISYVGGNATYSGLDANVMFLLKKSFNADFRITILSNGAKLDPFEEGLYRLDTRKAELIMTTYFVKPYEKHKSCAFTVGVLYDKVCLIAKSAGRVPKSFMPFLPISLKLWPILILYNIFISILWLWFKYVNDQICQEVPINRDKKIKSQKISDNNYPPKIHSGVIACVDVTEMSCSHLKGAETTPQRFFVAGTLLFSVVVLGLYESTLISSLSKPFRYRELHTLQDVAEANLPIVTKYTNLKSSTFYNSTLMDNVVIIKNFKLSTRHLVTNNKSILGMLRFSTFELDDGSEFYDEDGYNKLHVIDECPAEYTLSYVVRRLSPYLQRINELLLKMSEAGLFRKWYDDMSYPFFKVERRKSEMNSGVRKKLTLMHYSITFLYLVASLLGCIVVFLAEIQFARIARS